MLAAGLTGTYHVVSHEALSKYDFGVRIARRFGFNPELIEPIRMQDFKRGAPRALDLTLKPDKVQDALGHPLPSVDEGIDRFYQRSLEEYPQQLQSYAL
jgi:dTDP-4-dehydrorhamnose reductase